MTQLIFINHVAYVSQYLDAIGRREEVVALSHKAYSLVQSWLHTILITFLSEEYGKQTCRTTEV